MKVVIGGAAKAELESAVYWYDEQLNGLGNRFAAEIHATVRRIVLFPQANTEIDSGIRRALVRTFPYGIIYAARPDLIEIIAIAHLHQKPHYWQDRIG